MFYFSPCSLNIGVHDKWTFLFRCIFDPYLYSLFMNSNIDIWCKNRCYDKGQYLLISINTKFIHFVLTTLYTCSILIWLFFYSRSYPYLLQSHLLHYHSGCEKSDDANAKIPSQDNSWLPTHLLALVCSRNSFL